MYTCLNWSTVDTIEYLNGYKYQNFSNCLIRTSLMIGNWMHFYEYRILFAYSRWKHAFGNLYINMRGTDSF